MSAERSPRPDEPGWTRLLPLLLVPVSLLPDLGAALPLRTYFFRDFGIAFAPWRLHAAREMLAGRLPAWNPYSFEGSFLAPTLYPPDLLLLLHPSPAVLSWLLTLHLPCAALAAYWLARELGASRTGAFTSGAAYALSGLALSSLNLYVYLQALALAPLVAGLLRRTVSGGRVVLLAAAVLAVSISTMAAEFTGQALVLGIALAVAAAPRWRPLALVGASVLLGLGLAALPGAWAAGFVGETVRGAGFSRDVALANSVHPVVLLQTLLPNLFGLPSLPAEAWWGGRFFSKGLPYFLSLYTGPLVLALAALGGRELRGPTRLALLALAGLGLAWALGTWGGLAPLLAEVPPFSAVRFPAKALLLPTLAASLLAGLGLDRVARDPRGARRLALVLGLLAALSAAVLTAVATASPRLVAWTGVQPDFWPMVVQVTARDALASFLVVGAGIVVSLAAAAGRLRADLAAGLLSVVLLADLVRAGAGLNVQTAGSYFELLPDLRALDLAQQDRRVLSFGAERSPAFDRFLAAGGAGRTLTGAFAHRQVFAPFGNVLDRVETAEGADPELVAPRRRELSPEDFEPARVGALLPWMRNASVTHVASFDPLAHPDLELAALVPLGPPGLDVHVYALSATGPRAFVACRVRVAATRDAALAAPYGERFDLGADVALEEADPRAGAPECTSGRVRRVSVTPGTARYDVEADGDGLLVLRESHANGWRASVDGRETRVLRANGKHRAVAFPAGRHEISLRYDPPGLRAGLAVTLASVVAALALCAWPPGRLGAP